MTSGVDGVDDLVYGRGVEAGDVQDGAEDFVGDVGDAGDFDAGLEGEVVVFASGAGEGVRGMGLVEGGGGFEVGGAGGVPCGGGGLGGGDGFGDGFF